MKNLNIFSLITMTIIALLTWNSLVQASVVEKVHLVENLDPSELREALVLMKQKGYPVSKKPLFSESKRALVITKTIKTESDLPSIQIDLMKKEDADAIPHTAYSLKVPTENIQEALQQFPSPDQLADENIMPVALQSR